MFPRRHSYHKMVAPVEVAVVFHYQLPPAFRKEHAQPSRKPRSNAKHRLKIWTNTCPRSAWTHSLKISIKNFL